MSIAERALEQARHRVNIAKEDLSVFKAVGYSNLATDAEERLEREGFILKAVEKQIPIQANHVTLKCPICRGYIENDYGFCPYCGQALKWEE